MYIGNHTCCMTYLLYFTWSVSYKWHTVSHNAHGQNWLTFLKLAAAARRHTWSGIIPQPFPASVCLTFYSGLSNAACGLCPNSFHEVYAGSKTAISDWATIVDWFGTTVLQQVHHGDRNVTGFNLCNFHSRMCMFGKCLPVYQRKYMQCETDKTRDTMWHYPYGKFNQ